MSRKQNDLQAAIDALCEEIADGHLKASTFPADFLIEVKDKIARLTAERDEHARWRADLVDKLYHVELERDEARRERDIAQEQ